MHYESGEHASTNGSSMTAEPEFEMERTVITTTLVAAGLSIVRVRRTPIGTEYLCDRCDALGATVKYYLVFIANSLYREDFDALRRLATAEGRVLAVVTRSATDGSMSWEEFTEAIGGVIPSWRALAPTFPDMLRVLAANALPQGIQGEPWRLFENAVADALEFLFGRRVRRLGGHKRGRALGDLLAQTPDRRIILVDAKASGEPFSIGGPELRPLKDYAELQKRRQSGQLPVGAVLVVAAGFYQDETRLSELAGSFLAETQVPLSYLRVDTLIQMLSQLADRPDLRNGIRWSRVICAGGSVSEDTFNKECTSVDEERVRRDS
jgi:hypothetical protein